MIKQADVVVMGSGAAGLAAANAALDAGAKVILFEKRPFQGGSVSNCPMSFSHVENDPAYKDAAFKVLNEYSYGAANPAVIRSYVDNSWRCRDLITELGVENFPVFHLDLKDIGNPAFANGFPAAIMTHGDMYFVKGRGKGHGFSLVCLRAMQKIKKLGAEVYFDTPVVDVITQDGKVSKVIAKNNKTGELIEVDCKAVIIASGGIMEDRSLLKEMTGFTYTDDNCSGAGDVLFNCFPHSKQTGDGQKLAWKLGGAKGAVAVTGHNLVPGPGIVGWSPWIAFDQTRVIQEQPYLWVNQNGKRFTDESLSNNHMYFSNGIKNQPGRFAYILFDDETRRKMEEDGVDYQYFIFQADKLTDVKGQFERLIKEQKNQHVFMADTLDELCAQSGISVDGLKETLNSYNQYCVDKQDKEFAKNPKFMLPVEKGPFYAMRVYCAGYDTIGGIRVNGKCEVIDEQGRGIEGLYAAGDNMLNEVFGNPPTGGCSGVGLAMTFGFVSGDNASAYALKNGR